MRCSIVIFSSRETPNVLLSCIRALQIADLPGSTEIDVLVNGNERLMDEIRAAGAGSARLWYLATSDKAHAWNEYLHRVWPTSDIAFFVDGYAIVSAIALSRLSDALQSSLHALAATGIPTSGRSAKRLGAEMLRAGGLHGNLHAIRGSVLAGLKSMGFRLPLGLYRTDSLVGAALCFNMSPGSHPWDPTRIVVQPAATWSFPALRWRSLKDLRVHLMRLLRQAQGILENEAIRDRFAVKKEPINSLPSTASELIQGWLDSHPIRALHIRSRHPMTNIALARLRKAPSLVASAPQRIDALERTTFSS